MTNADKLRLIGDAISKHQAAGGGAGHAWDIAIFDAGYAAALANAIRDDAARYRWLRDIGNTTWTALAARSEYTAAQIDAAIDEAKGAKPLLADDAGAK